MPMTGLPVPVVVGGRPADDEAVATAEAPAGEGARGDRDIGARGMARGRVSIFTRSSGCLPLLGIPMVEGNRDRGGEDVAMIVDGEVIGFGWLAPFLAQ